MKSRLLPEKLLALWYEYETEKYDVNLTARWTPIFDEPKYDRDGRIFLIPPVRRYSNMFAGEMNTYHRKIIEALHLNSQYYMQSRKEFGRLNFREVEYIYNEYKGDIQELSDMYEARQERFRKELYYDRSLFERSSDTIEMLQRPISED